MSLALALRTDAPMTAVERLEALCDHGSLEVIRSDVVSIPMGEKARPGDGVVGGAGLVDGRPVFCYAQDPSYAGGSLGEQHANTIVRRELLGYLPCHRDERPPVADSRPAPSRDPGAAVPVEARRVYDVRDVIRALVDEGELLEVSAGEFKGSRRGLRVRVAAGRDRRHGRKACRRNHPSPRAHCLRGPGGGP